MNSDLLLVLCLLAGCIVMFAANKPRIDVVALLAIVALPLTGVVGVNEALAGFSDPSVILIAALFVMGEGLVRTGIAYRMGDLLVSQTARSETRLLALLMILVAGLGAFMSSTGVVAIFIPVTLSVAARLQVPAGRLMMPLSFAGLISGMLSLVATPPNMVVDSALKRAGEKGLGFFSFTPIGLVILALGVGYMLLARRWLAGAKTVVPPSADRLDLRNLFDQYHLDGWGHAVQIRPNSPLVGRTLEQLDLRCHHEMNVIAIERNATFHHDLLSPHAQLQLQVGDVLLVDRRQSGDGPLVIPPELELQTLDLADSHFADLSKEVGLAEIMLPPDSRLIDRTIRDNGFRTKYGLNVAGLRRNRDTIDSGFLDEKLRFGDTLLVIGPWAAIRRLQTKRHDFVVLSLPAEIDAAAPALRQAPLALLALVLMIVLMVTGAAPNVLAGLIACLAMGLFRCIDMDSAYRSIHWQSLIVIVGMMPFALALEKTGGMELAVRGFIELFGSAGPRTMLAGLFVLTSVTGLFISNTATAVLMAPIALSIAQHVGASPRPFAMTVALAASAAFMTPVSSPVNTLVLGPGQYRFMDFVKVGVPFTLLTLAVTVLMVPWLFPL